MLFKCSRVLGNLHFAFLINHHNKRFATTSTRHTLISYRQPSPSSSIMSVEQCPTQPKTGGCLFKLPPELRLIIWEMVISNPTASRICPLSYCFVSGTIKQYQTRQVLGISMDALFVYDYCNLRHICRDVRHETTPLYEALGWQFDGQGLLPPRRPYNPDFDILYPEPTGFSHLAFKSTDILTQHGPESPLSIIAMQVKNTRHIAIDKCQDRGFDISEDLPHIERISRIITNVGWKVRTELAWWGRTDHHLWLDLPMRPCTLDRVPSFLPPKTESTEETLAKYARRYHIKRPFLEAAQEYVRFSRKTGLPKPQSAMLLQMVRPGEEWEEVEVSSSGFVIKPHRSVGV